MAFLKDLFYKWKEKQQNAAREIEEMDDERTTDHYLRSLRRWKRRQNEEIEKQELVKQIRQYEFERTNKYLWGTHKPKQESRKKYTPSAYNLNGGMLKSRKIKQRFKL